MSEKSLTQSLSPQPSGSLPNRLGTITPVPESLLSCSEQKKKAIDRCNGYRKLEHNPTQIAEELEHKNGCLYFKKERPGRSTHKQAGYIRSDGYRAIHLMGQNYLAHRVVWCLEFGAWPLEQIDHIDGNRDNNHPSNLREASIQENRRNVTVANNASGVVGVTWAKKEGNWRVSISDCGKAINWGHFDNLQDAINARIDAEIYYGYR
jgi:hypothetical protein